MRTVRAADLAHVYSHPGPQLAILERRGVVHKLAYGFYCGVPSEYVGVARRPTIEAATAAVATVMYGDCIPVLTGLTAARLHRALPRAIGFGATISGGVSTDGVMFFGGTALSCTRLAAAGPRLRSARPTAPT